MIKIVHIITGLGSGGAENMLYKLVKYSDKKLYTHEVISLLNEGVMGEKLKKEGVKVHSLNISWKNLIPAFIKARNIAKDFDIINTWLYHADIFGFFITKSLSKSKLIWNIRHSNLDKEANHSTTLKIIKINSVLSKFVDCITFNSKEALLNHANINYSQKNSVTIPNGFELDEFKYNSVIRKKVREELSVDHNEKVLITVGRWHIQKDYKTLLRALDSLKQKDINFKLLMVGTKLEKTNNELVELIEKYDLSNDIQLLGRRDDIPNLLSAADIYVSSSIGESFSNAIGEAMASELHLVVTDVGESKIVVGETGRVVNPSDSSQLAQSLSEYLLAPTSDKNHAARSRVREKYEIKVVVKKIESIFSEIY